MQFLIIFVTVASVLLFRRFKIRQPWKAAIVLCLSIVATITCWYIMMSWSKVTREVHQIGCAQLYTAHPEEDNFITANITVFPKTAYCYVHNKSRNLYQFQYFEYKHIDGKEALPRTYNSIEEVKSTEIYQYASKKMSADLSETDHLSSIIISYPSWIYQSFNVLPYKENENHNEEGTFGYDLDIIYESDTLNSGSDTPQGQKYYNKIVSYLFNKGVKKTEQVSLNRNFKNELFRGDIDILDMLAWIAQANDLSRSEHVFLIKSDGVDSLNLTLHFDEAIDVQRSWMNQIEKSPYHVKYSIGGYDRESKSSKISSYIYHMNFHVRHLESENIQQIRMFFISTICALSLGVLLHSLMSIVTLFVNCLINIKK